MKVLNNCSTIKGGINVRGRTVGQVIQHILSWIEKRKTIPDSELYDFSKNMSDILEASDYEALGESYHILQEAVELYEEFDLPTEPEYRYAFSMGEIQGILRIADEMKRQKQISNIIDVDYQSYLPRYKIFQLVDEHPGITHKELAKKGSMKVSNLTHFMEKAEAEKYFYSWRNGRNKYYHLGKKGKILLEKIEEQRHAIEYRAIEEQSIACILDEDIELDNSMAGNLGQNISFLMNTKNSSYNNSFLVPNRESRKKVNENKKRDNGGYDKNENYLRIFTDTIENREEIIDYA
ncbi:MAG: hypothetical protein HFG55_08730 [Lachnospiraceae bacterium]|nr:hypothetical protein [Lachnospiraceae bacterium]